MHADGARIEEPQDHRRLVGRDPHERRRPSRLGGAHEPLGVARLDRPVLGIEDEEVEALQRDQLASSGSGYRQKYPDTQSPAAIFVFVPWICT
jgi:hypothetical protein